MYNRIAGDCANLTSELRQHGVKGELTINLSSERDGEAFESALAGKICVDYVPYDPAIAQVQRTAVIGGITFIWPAADLVKARQCSSAAWIIQLPPAKGQRSVAIVLKGH